MLDALGWVSSLILLVTIWAQIQKQWTERTSKGVSSWLFVGQTAASIGFTTYSALVGNWVFTVTNALLLCSGLVGWGISARFRRKTAGVVPRAALTRS